MLGATEPGAHIRDWQAMLIELVLTAGLVSTILGTASRAQNVGPLSALGVGGYIVLAGSWSSPVSGASMNPARSFAPDLVIGDFGHFWVYIVGPLAGALIAVVVAWILRGPGGDPGGLAAARGMFGPHWRRRGAHLHRFATALSELICAAVPPAGCGPAIKKPSVSSKPIGRISDIIGR